MITTIVLAAVLAGQQPAPEPQQAPPPTASIRGRVVAADGGQPLRNAQVQIGQIDAPSTDTRVNRTATTDANGVYEFSGLPAGRYVVSAWKGAYVRLQWGQEQSTSAGKPIDLPARERLDRVDFALPRGGVITGRIVDEFGEPLQGLRVSAVRPGSLNGARQMMTAGSSSTNDIGEFRIYGVPPGQYYVQALFQRIGPGDAASIDRTGYPLTFFPGTPSQAEAQRFNVAAGRTIGDLVMTMPSIKTARVAGLVVDRDGQPVGNVTIEMLSTVGGSNAMSRVMVPGGAFTFASLAPGDYAFRTVPTPERPDVAMLRLALNPGDDVKDLRLVTMPQATISGRIVLEPWLTPPAAALSIMAAPDNQTMPGGVRPAKVADDMTFELNAQPGRNRVAMLNLPSGWMVRAVRVDSVDVIDDGIEVSPAQKITGVDVELTNKVGTVSGLVTDARGDPSKDYSLVLFPADNKAWKPASRFLRTGRPDQDGRFKLTNLPAGDYYIVAVDKLDPGQWTDPEFLERLVPSSKRVTLAEGETKTMELKLAVSP
jgi:protocatechuate 3,4-dioxygenase beta subunit